MEDRGGDDAAQRTEIPVQVGVDEDGLEGQHDQVAAQAGAREAQGVEGQHGARAGERLVDGVQVAGGEPVHLADAVVNLVEPPEEGNLVGGMIDQYLEGNFPGLLGSGEQCWSFAFNADVVAAHLAALEGGRLGEEYVLGGDNRSLNEFFQLLGELSGVQRRVRHLPFLAGKMVGALDLARAELFGRPPQLTPGVVEIFRHDWVYSSAKAAKELGYRVTPLDEGVRKTLQNLKGEG